MAAGLATQLRLTPASTLPHRRRHPSQPPKVQPCLLFNSLCSYIDPSYISLTMAPKDTIYYDLLEVKVDATPIEYVSLNCMHQNQPAD